MFDLTVMDFARWGMGHAVPRFRDTSVDGMNLMDRLCDMPGWIATEPGREHHKQWHQLVTHPDARLMESAPDLLRELDRANRLLAELTFSAWITGEDTASADILQRIKAAHQGAHSAITKATGVTA